MKERAGKQTWEAAAASHGDSQEEDGAANGATKVGAAKAGASQAARERARRGWILRCARFAGRRGTGRTSALKKEKGK